MFKWLKKLLGLEAEEPNSQESMEEASDSIFPTTEEMLEKTSATWPTVSREEILKKITHESKNGDRRACFFNSKIDDETRKELIRQHYKVEPIDIGSCPGFSVSW